MSILSDELLVESYYKAIELKLEGEFIRLLLAEIRLRQLPLL
ncbi:sporulation histidine kinase inhibitor Sda [Paenibacillus guangzhouensis]|nr:sporulation histidine kinase inhibitor Sda [Paenibacillus guangzhouensis]